MISTKMSAIPFIQMDAAGKISLNDAAVKIVQGVTGKFSVIIVAGPYRTGKSYLTARAKICIRFPEDRTK